MFKRENNIISHKEIENLKDYVSGFSVFYNCKENFFMWKVVDITKDFSSVLSVLFSTVEVMIRKSLTAPNIRRLEQLLAEEDSDSEQPDLSDPSDHSDLSSESSAWSRTSCTCHCQCKIHNKRRRLNIKKKKTDTNNTRRSSFSERSSNFHVKTGISTSVSLSLRSGNKI